MLIDIINDDLFKSNDNLAHCVSEDMKMGKGIALIFKEKYGSVDKLLEQKKTVGEVAYIKYENKFIFYLITKRVYYGKPTYKNLATALMNLYNLCHSLNIKTISMPKIGCGLDKLNWEKVLSMLTDIFIDIDVNIYIPNS